MELKGFFLKQVTAEHLVLAMMDRSQFVSVMPLPGDEFEVLVKPEAFAMAQEVLNTLQKGSHG